MDWCNQWGFSLFFWGHQLPLAQSLCMQTVKESVSPCYLTMTQGTTLNFHWDHIHIITIINTAVMDAPSVTDTGASISAVLTVSLTLEHPYLRCWWCHWHWSIHQCWRCHLHWSINSCSVDTVTDTGASIAAVLTVTDTGASIAAVLTVTDTGASISTELTVSHHPYLKHL